ncbi:winged helix-turn-helix transcriptional regulator [Streptomyces sp. NPDC001415]|uniref:Helix-turn-helix transcriptional regulator n=1 Tax=Streptomyces sp. NBC_00003 TaxID=2903608 RepID=A0AAU2UZG5_9ACTN
MTGTQTAESGCAENVPAGGLLPDLPAVRAVVDVISGKWDLTVLVELWPQSRGHAELGRATRVERKQLTRVLRRLEESGLIDRTVRTDRPPVRVSYGLTAKGRQLLRNVDELARWWASAPGSCG